MPGVLVWIAAFLGVGALTMALANRGIPPARARQRWHKFATYLVVIGLLVGLTGAGGLPWLAVLILLGGAWELARVLPRRSRPPLSFGVWPAFATLALGLLGFSITLPPPLQLSVVLQVLVFDGFSQVSGQLLGRHPLAPRISPAKTREGLLGGLLACLSMAMVIRPIPTWGVAMSLTAGAFTAVLALAGDLAASALKRRCGVKDFSALIPGHGGVLDRFDSLLVAATGWTLLWLSPIRSLPGWS